MWLMFVGKYRACFEYFAGSYCIVVFSMYFRGEPAKLSIRNIQIPVIGPVKGYMGQAQITWNMELLELIFW